MKAAGYIRVSTDEQAEGGVSMDETRHQILERIDEREDWTLFKIFSDVISGSHFDRRGLQEMLGALKEFDVLVVWRVDRLGREFIEQIACVGKLREAGVKLEVLNGPVDLDTPEGKAQFGMQAVFAEYERDTIIGRTRMAAEAIAREGRYNGPRPYGYTFEEKELTPVPLEVAIVLRIFDRFNAGHGYTQISRELNADQVPTKRGGNWRVATIREMIANPIYLGRFRFHGEELEGSHEGIVAPDVFAKAQVLAKAQGTPRGKGRGRKPNGSHLFIRGLLRCGQCGEAMVPRTGAGRGPQAYLCNGRQVHDCSMPIAYRADIDKAVYSYFEQVGLDVEATRQTIIESRDRQLAEIRELLVQATREQRRAEDRLARVRRDYQDGKLDAEDWREQREELQAELDAAAGALARLRAQEEGVATWTEFADAEQLVLEHLTEIRRAVAGDVTDAKTIEPVRAALASAFERFVLHRGDSPDVPTRLHAELAMVGESGFVIEPMVREQAIEGYSESMRPVLHREPLVQAGNNERKGYGYRLLDR